jgi:hypothetical protein
MDSGEISTIRIESHEIDRKQIFDYVFKVVVENQDIRKQENLHRLSHL